jgi:hypothetical protein
MPYPDACAKYVDTDIDGICDYSDSEGLAGNTPAGMPPGSTPPVGVLAVGIGAGCIVMGISIGRMKNERRHGSQPEITDRSEPGDRPGPCRERIIFTEWV